jgi:two-component system, cell cycle sensor histidine kinase DivJ
VVTALAALGLRAVEPGPGLSGPVFFGMLAMAVPGLAGLTLLWRDGPRARLAVLGIWSLAAAVTALLSGGVGGSLSGYLLMPVAAGLLLGTGRPGGLRLALLGTAASALSALIGMGAALMGDASVALPFTAAFSALSAAGATAVALQLAWRRRESELADARASVRRVETVLSAQPGLTLILDGNARVLAAYGVPPAPLPVAPLLEDGLMGAVHAPDRQTLMSALQRAGEGGEVQIRFTPRKALDRRIALLLRRMDSTEGEVRLIAQAFDATDAHVREVALDTARAEAEATSRSKSRFLATMSHELRTPLNAVLGFADIMRQSLFGPLPERYADYAQSIHSAGEHLLDLINDVLDVSKIEAERYQLSMERFDARELLSDALALVRTRADETGVHLSAVLPSEPVLVEADRRALKQIALNLLANAVKFTPAEGSVTVTVEGIGPYLEMIVSDTGTGIAPEDLKRLGRPFEQAGGGEQRAQGTGLGLSLARALSELHGGRLSIESTLGEGTAVTVRLPIHKQAFDTGESQGAEIIAFAPAAAQAPES